MADAPVAAAKKDFAWGWIAAGVIVFLLIAIGAIYYYNKEFLSITPPANDPLKPKNQVSPANPTGNNPA